MKRTTEPKRKAKLLLSVAKIRALDNELLKKTIGGACPRSKPVAPTG